MVKANTIIKPIHSRIEKINVRIPAKPLCDLNSGKFGCLRGRSTNFINFIVKRKNIFANLKKIANNLEYAINVL